MKARNIDRWETAGAMLTAVTLGAVAVGILFGVVYVIKLAVLWGIGS